jgi:hypothetical protein
VELVNAWGWNKFTVLYEDGSGLVRLNSLLKMFDKKFRAVTVRQLDTRGNHRPVLRDIRFSGERNILLDCSIKTLPEVLKQAQQVGLMTSEQSYIITSLVSLLELYTIALASGPYPVNFLADSQNHITYLWCEAFTVVKIVVAVGAVAQKTVTSLHHIFVSCLFNDVISMVDVI